MHDTQARADLATAVRQGAGVIPVEKIPEIDLYMDQLTTFMEERLKACKRTDEEKVLTKTMINNYSKDKMIPPSVKKKYAKEHMMALVMIYHLKGVLSISDIASILSGVDTDTALIDMYEAFVQMQESAATAAADAIPAAQANAETLLPAHDEKTKALSAAIALALDAAAKKRAAERMLDSLLSE